MKGKKFEEIGGSYRGMYIRNTADIPEINKIPPLTLRNFAYLADMQFRFASPKLLRNFAYPPCRYLKAPMTEE